jgi:hypothetical protein
MPIKEVVRLLSDVAQQADVVGLGITEFLPWDMVIVRDMLRELPIFGRRWPGAPLSQISSRSSASALCPMPS